MLLGRLTIAGLTLATLLLAACATIPAVPPRASPTSPVAGIQTPRGAPTIDGVVTVTVGSCACSTLHLTAINGDQLGSATLGAPGADPLAAGGNGGYFVSADRLRRLGADGTTVLVGAVAKAPTGSGVTVGPQPQLGSLAVAPGGSQWAYLQTLSSGGVQTHQVWSGGPNRSPRVLVSTVENPAQPGSEFPGGWSYQLLGWDGGYLVLAETPVGAGSAASFDSQAWQLSLVSPQTGAATSLSNSQNCPVSSFASDLQYSCFQQGQGAAPELVIGADGVSTGSWPLSSAYSYGAAVFNSSGTELVFSACVGCGSIPSSAYLGSQMEVLDSSSGAISTVGPAGLVAAAWLPNGEIVATQYSQVRNARTGALPLSQVVLVAPGSGAVTPLTTDTSSQFVGIATG